MDKFDQQIIELLSQDARQSNAEIGRHIGLSRTAVLGRIQKLEQQGVITGYRVELSKHRDKVAAFYHINHNLKSCELLLPAIQPLPEVRNCHAVAGDVDMIVYAEADSMTQLDSLRDRLHAIAGITSITTKIVYKHLLAR